jgi:hypothetical protein
MYDFTPLQLFYSAFRCPATWTPAGVGAGRVGVGVVRLPKKPTLAHSWVAKIS